MNKIAAMTLTGMLTVLSLSGCSDESAPTTAQQSANFLPESTYSIVETETDPAVYGPLPDVMDLPMEDASETLENTPSADGITAEPTEVPPWDPRTEDTPEPTAESTPEPTPEATPEVTSTATPTATPEPEVLNYTYSELTDDVFGFTMCFPTNWQNLPGKYTACFREITQEGDFPARVAVTRKHMPHKPTKSATILKQFQKYASNIQAQYDEETFEYGELNESATFMGKNAMEITYLAYAGETEVMGYMICCAIDYDIYVFHFCSSYEDYPMMLPSLTRMRDSVKVIE